MRWKCGEQVYNTELVLEGCGAGILILRSYEGSCGKVHQCEWMLFGLASHRGIGVRVHNSEKMVEGRRRYCNAIVRWKCGERIYNSELVLEGARQPYTTLNALWNEWTSGIQQLMCDGLGADGYRWLNNCSSDWLDFASPSASQL
ncbi:hypothetical protein T05_1066 [Trichinella murrelli]|uniref:Uncharacterized protein n=1 Tax=Trichinella murrelli TaxID=144512 RepID=A0A0V0T8R2_9BILA|nr:hypothetical protein T05_1066 [Trichinella murrelli]